MVQNGKDNRRGEEAARQSERVLLLLGRLTVLRGLSATLPVVHLSALCDALADGNAVEAVYEYHAMTAALLESGSRRVTGNIWKDFLFAQLLESPNRFAQLAAAGAPDPPVHSAMGHDLQLLQELFDLNSEALVEQIDSSAQSEQRSHEERIRSNEKWVQREQRISHMASSAWGLGRLDTEKPEPATNKPPVVHRPVAADLPRELNITEWIQWQYDEPAAPVYYVADEALALLYREFLSAEDWSDLTEKLWDFHAKYGCGEFLRYRLFAAFSGRLFGMEDDSIPAWDSVLSLGQQKELLYANALRFLHTGKAENTLLYGVDGMGKTSLLLALTDELPELRVVLLPSVADNLQDIMLALHKQPFRFLALIDDAALDIDSYRKLKAIATFGRSFDNILLCATAREQAPDSSIFSLQIPFPMPSYDEFRQTVYSLAAARIPNISRERVGESCDAQRRNSSDFSIRTAIATADQLVRWYQR